MEDKRTFIEWLDYFSPPNEKEKVLFGMKYHSLRTVSFRPYRMSWFCMLCDKAHSECNCYEERRKRNRVGNQF